MSLSKPTQTITVVQSGAVSAANGIGAFVLPKDADLVAITAYAATAPVGAAMIVNVAKNGTKIWATTERLTIAAGSNAATKLAPKDAKIGVNVIDPVTTATPPLATFVGGTDVVRVDVDQVGSTTAGSNLTVILEFKVK